MEGDRGVDYSAVGLRRAADILMGVPSATAKFYREGKFREGVVFLGEALVKLSAELFGIRKLPSESYREFFEKLHERLGIEPGYEEGEGLVETIELALYSPEPVEEEEFLSAVRQFTKVVRRIRETLSSAAAEG